MGRCAILWFCPRVGTPQIVISENQLKGLLRRKNPNHSPCFFGIVPRITSYEDFRFIVR